METTVGIVTALNPVLGYEKATELADEAYKSGKGILEIIREKKLLTEAADQGSARPGEADAISTRACTRNQIRDDAAT